jgi:uncharacterized membrane protein YczE
LLLSDTRTSRAGLARIAARFLIRLGVTTVGLFIFSLGVVLNLQSNAGLSPWQALHVGMTLHTPLSFGQASQVVGVVMLLASWVTGVRPGLATLMNAVLVGVFSDLLLASDIIPMQSSAIRGLPMLAVSLVVSGLGIAFYIRGGLGAGPRDGFMLALMRLSGRGAAPVRIGIEVGAALGGLMLGAPLGIGTVLFAVGLGPSVSFWFKVLGVKPPVRRPAPTATAPV